MNPEYQPTTPSPERPIPAPSVESSGNHLPVTPEINQPGIERGAEAKEAASEARAASSDAAVITSIPFTQGAPSIPEPSLPVDSIQQEELLAADENEIEKEWVERTQKIISSTKGDPFQREKQIVDVREEYQRKRFNRTRGDGQS